MRYRYLTKFLVAGLTCSSLLVSTSQSVLGNSLSDKPTKTAPTMKFLCKDKGNNVYETWAKGLLTGREVGPLFIWQYAEYEEWTPDRICNHVTNKLNQKYKENGYYLSGLGFKIAPINEKNSLYRICLVKDSDESCRSKNQLFQTKNRRAIKQITTLIEEFGS